MEMSGPPTQGWYSLLRWRSDAVRDEARNVAILLVGARGGFSAFRPAPLSRISSRLHDQGLLDAALVSLGKEFEKRQAVTLERLTSMHEALDRSLYLTKPKPVAVSDPEEAATALYRAYIAPRGGGSRRLTKGVILDRVVTAYRKRGLSVKRGAYIDDFIFDAVIKNGTERQVVEVLSFAAPRKDWIPVERDAGHFLFALEQLDVPGRAVIQPPSQAPTRSAKTSYERIRRWLDNRGVPIAAANDVIDPQQELDLVQG